MAEPFLSEIRIMTFNFAPKGWAQCNGQLLPINQNQALFSLLGTTYGGNGQTNFALPDLRGRVPIHVGQGHGLGEGGGAGPHAVDLGDADAPAPRERIDGLVRRERQPDGQVPRQREQHVPRPHEPHPDERRNDHERRREPGSPEHAAVPDTHFCIALQGIFPSRN